MAHELEFVDGKLKWLMLVMYLGTVLVLWFRMI